ncbi:hypothetical protein ACFW04_002798 [Cataglyphis niger]
MIANGTESFFAGHELRELTFGWTDYILFGGLLGISVLIGIYFGFFSTKQDNTTEYLLGGKTMSFLPISMSLIASHISGVSLLGVPSEVYQYGTQYAACIFTSFISCFLIIFLYLPVFYKLQLKSTFEYLEIRFARPVRILASFLYTLSLIVYVPLIIYVPALAFSQATGMNLYYVAPVICLVCIFYTTIGGLKAVVWADTVQMTVTVGSLVAVLILGTIAVGGVGATWRIAEEGGRIVFWKYFRRSIWFLAVGLVVVKFISVFTGLTMYARYHKCDPITAHVVARSDKILPYYVLDVAADVPGLPGLFLAGLVSAGLSTMSAGLNTVAGTIYEDFIDRWMPESNDKETKAANVMKVTVVILGILCVGMVFLVDRLGDIFQLSLTVTGITAGAMLGLFSLGMLVPWATTKGAVVGGLMSMVTMIWIIVGAQWHMVNRRLYYEPLPSTTDGCLNMPGLLNRTVTTTQNLVQVESVEDEPFFMYRISFMYYTLLGALIVIVIGTIVSFVCGAPDLSDVNRDHFAPFITR